MGFKMTVNVISTVNGLENEGMRNVATHILRYADDFCKIRRSPLGNPAVCIMNTVGADAVVIFARASGKVAKIASVLRMLCPRIYIVLVQKPEPAFLSHVKEKAGKYSYFSITKSDGEVLAAAGNAVYDLPVGIDSAKFRPAENEGEILRLREKYGFDRRPLVLHVGHLSPGRGLEAFLNLPEDKYNRLVIASGMFSDDGVRQMLTDDGVTVIERYLEDVSEVYRMADVYLFPTKSAEFVISIPLSVMEALACGVPAVSFEGVKGIDAIFTTSADDITVLPSDIDCKTLETTISAIAEKAAKRKKSLLRAPLSWKECADKLFEVISADVEKSNAK